MTVETLNLTYQDEGTAFLASKFRAGLYDEMRLGKCRQSIRALDKIKARRGIVVAPAGVHDAGTWMGEFKRWTTVPRKILKGYDIQHLNLWLRGRIDVLLLSYEMAAKWAKRMEGDIFDFIIFDEAEALTNKTANRTSTMLGPECDGKHGLARWACHCWFLTGTPTRKDASNIWSMARFCGATKCTQRIFNDRYFRKYEGAYSAKYEVRDDMVEELRQVIRSFSLRRTQKDVGLQFPPIWLTTTEIDGDTQEIRSLLHAYPNLEAAIIEAVDKGGLSFLDAQHIATLRRLVGEAKAPAFVKLLVQEINDGLDKAVVFGIHTRAMDIIENGLRSSGIGVVRFDGSTSKPQRSAAISSFRDDPGVKVFLGQLEAVGAGNDMTVAADITLFESAWTPTRNAQGIMRCQGMAQTQNIRARFITLRGSIDEKVSDIVARRTRDMIKTGTFRDIAA